MKKLTLLVLIIILAATGCSGASNNSIPDSNKQTGKNKNKVTISPSAIEDEDKEYGVGETAEINGVKLTLESVEMSYGDRDEDFSSFAPEKGKVFAVCNFLVENDSKEDFDISSLYFNAYEDGFAVDTYIFTDGIGVTSLSGTASPGKKIKGALVYEVSETFEELEIEYRPSLWNDKKVKFIYVNK